MTKWFLCLLLFPLYLFANQLQLSDATLAKIEKTIETVQETYDIPGMAVGIVRDGQVYYLQGFGLRDVASCLPVTPETLFPIGSITKSFTSFALGTLVDEAKLDWDDPVSLHLSDFRLNDPYLTSQVTVRDLLSHRTGLPRHDLSWYTQDISREDVYKSIAHLEPTAKLRERFQYQNHMYLVAGKLIEKLTHSSWEEALSARILSPLSMHATNFSTSLVQASSNFALPYAEKEGALKTIPFHSISHVGPAGSINSNLKDMLAWMQMLLKEGDSLIETSTLHEMHTAQIPAPLFSSGYPDSNKSFLMSYGLGWIVSSYQGHYMVSHGGAIDGFSANLALLPLDQTGVVILTNKNGAIIPIALLTNAILDHLIGEEPAPFPSKQELEQIAAAENELYHIQLHAPLTHPSESYVGKFKHPAYGTIDVWNTEDGLKAKLNEYALSFKHLYYDAFEAAFADEHALPMKFRLNFTTNLDGDIQELIFPSPEGYEVRFQKCAEEALFSEDYLRSFTGIYHISGMKITVACKNKVLKLSVPGQPTCELIPKKENQFDVKGMNEFSVEFIFDDAHQVEKMVVIQPQGTFVATP